MPETAFCSSYARTGIIHSSYKNLLWMGRVNNVISIEVLYKLNAPSIDIPSPHCNRSPPIQLRLEPGLKYDSYRLVVIK